MKTYKKYLTAIIVSSSIVFFAGCEKKDEQKVIVKKEGVSKVNVHTLQKQTYPIWVDFSGKTRAVQEVTIVPRVSGELKESYFKAGDLVKKGQLLFKIDDSEYQAILAQKKATLKKDIASLNLAIANVKRYKPLVEKQLAPLEKLDELIASQKQLEAVVNADKSVIKQVQLDVEYCSIRATIDGQIGKQLVDLGNIVTSSSELANIVQTNYLYVNFNPSNNEVSMMKKYKSMENPIVNITPENSGNNILQLDGAVDFIDNITNETTGTVAMRAKINNKEKILFPGTFVDIKLFITDKIPVIAVHPNNISQNQLGSYVLIVDESNKIQTKQIEITYSNKDLVIVKSGLKDGDKVVVSPIKKLKNSQVVVALEVKNPISK